MAMRWYSVSVFSNFEKKVAENIKEMVLQKNLENDCLLYTSDAADE